MTDNADQIAYWNGPGADRWVRNQEKLDRSLAPFARLALEAARAQPDERVLDVGCGCGGTALALAESVGPRGAVLGVDISAPMLELARTRASAFANVTFTLADASAHPFEAAFDLVFSRFGVMFFRDPVGAFANLRRALRPGGRVAFVCWGPVVENPWFRIPLAAVGTVLSLPTPASPDEPGPFAFADRDRLVRILEEAGFTRITLDRSTPELVLGDDLDAAATYAIETGPVSRILVDADEATRGRARTAIRQSLEPYAGPHGVALGSSTWVVRANGG